MSGGELTVSVDARIFVSGETTAVDTVSDSETLPLTGENPSFPQISGITGTDETGIIRLAVSWKESCHSQFDYPGDGCATRDDQLPIFGGPDGWGLMQLDNLGDWNDRRNESHFWNWRENLQLGINYLDRLYDDADNYFQTFHVPIDPNNPDNDAWTWDPDDAETTGAVRDRIWNDAFSRYNTGRPIYSPNGHGGETHCNRETEYDYYDEDNKLQIDPFMNPTGCRYRTSIRQIIDATPPLWTTTP